MVQNVNIADIQIKTNMVASKHCAWGTCKNDSRYPQLWTKNKKGDPISFFRFPAPKRSPEKRNRWIKSCHRGDGFECKKDHYICSLHFVGENGPTKEYPDPISAITSEENVSCFVFRICYWFFSVFKHH